MKEMVKNAWEMMTEKEKRMLDVYENMRSASDLMDLVEPDWEINEWKSAKELHDEILKELLGDVLK